MSNSAMADSWTFEDAAHLLNRAGFGGTPGEISTLHRLGRAAAVEQLLRGSEDEDLFPPPALTQPAALFAARQEALTLDDAGKRLRFIEARKQQGREIRDLRDWWLQRMRYTTHPLREKMTLFWHGHFATSFQKVNVSYLIWQQNDTLRANALGSFREMTKQIARDPAMMRYLDLARSERERPNENFSRELMELFTLGEGVVYTEHDVQEGARALTGYRIDQRTLQFRFARRQFDDTPKSFLGHQGSFDGDDVVDIICQRPECAAFITGKVWTFFADGTMPEALQQKLAGDFQRSDYDVRTLLRGLFLSPEFYASARRQVKSPVQWLVQTSRELEAPLPTPGVNENALRQLGQVLFMPPNVKGWEGGRTWINGSTFLYRCNLAGQMVGSEDKPEGMKPLDVPWDRVAPPSLRANPRALCDELIVRFFQGPIPEADRHRYVEFLQERGGGVDEAALRDLVHLMMSNPHYQLT